MENPSPGMAETLRQLTAVVTEGLRSRLPPDYSLPDTSEQLHISSLALLKMLKHGAKAGVPMEVMGLMLGEFVDDYTVRVVDVFAMPQSGTGISVESVDHVYQTNMLDSLKQSGRSEMVVGWYHSHPGFSCWLSKVDMTTQRSFEQLNKRAVAVVIDPIRSVKGKVIIDAFRLFDPITITTNIEPRLTTSSIVPRKPSATALVNGLNQHYYSIGISYRKDELEETMLMNLYEKRRTDGLVLDRYDTLDKANEQKVEEMLDLSTKYNKVIHEEDELPPEKLAIANVGKLNVKRRLEDNVSSLMSSNILRTLGMMLNTTIF